MSYREIKDLCKHGWRQKYSYHKINKVDDDNNFSICTESNQKLEFFEPVTDAF